MNKVFSAKRKSVEFDYEFLDSSTKTLKVQSLSSKEQSDISKMKLSEEKDINDRFKEIIEMQLVLNDKKDVKRVIDEQFKEGDLIEFSNSLGSLIQELKAKK